MGELMKLKTTLLSASLANFGAVALLLAAIGCTPKTDSGSAVSELAMITALNAVEKPQDPATGALRGSAASRRLAALKAKHGIIPSPSRNNFSVSAGVNLALSAEVTLLKSAILGREMLYGSDLQYSSIGDTTLSLLMQSLAIGHVPARFNIVGDRLQLVADQSRLFQSDINHPGRLINDFRIVHQDADTVTVSIERASPLLTTLLTNNSASPARTDWVRSVEYVRDGNYLLIETSVEQSDGTIGEFMETVFPRDSIVPAGSKPLLVDTDREPLSERFRFLGNEKLFVNFPDEGRQLTQVASRYNVSAEKGVIEWYVTRNAPEKYLTELKTAVEGWNRYSQSMWGRDFIKFNGYLPDGIKLGDPRFNVINWDSVPEAGAAYESQAVDPLTGIQSHSLIYLPYAWIKIGEQYWENGNPSDLDNSGRLISEALRESSFLGRKVSPTCLNEVTMGLSLAARTSPDKFARELFKGVLFHEVGHALGLAHNFKGSLSWNPDDQSTIFSTSIMDYNQYQIEHAAFDAVDSDKGPLLEYDRQILLALYNEGKGLENAPLVPTCNDEEADDLSAGVDPLCLRYDSGSDPTKLLQRTIALVKDPTATIGQTKSLAAAIESSLSVLLDPATATDEAQVKAQIAALTKQVLGVNSWYLASGAQSLRYMMQANIKSLYQYRESVKLTADEKAASMGRTIDSLNYVMNFTKLEPSSAEALAMVNAKAKAWVQATAWFQAAGSDKETKMVAILAPLGASRNVIESKIMPVVQARVLAAMTFSATSPFYFSISSAPVLDNERLVLDTLESALTKPVDGALRSESVRTAAAKALITFRDVLSGKDSISRVQSKLAEESSASRTADQRKTARNLLAILTTAPTDGNE